MPQPDPARRYLPPGFPMPDPDALAALRRSVMAETATRHPPDAAELAVLIAADEAGIDLAGVDAAAVWALAPDDREPLFARLGQLLAEIAG